MDADIRSLTDVPLEGRRVFCRVDFNVPLEGSEVTDDTRIRAALPTIEHIQNAGGRLVLASHLGRPKGEPKAHLSLEPAAMRLAELLTSGEVRLTDDCIGAGARKVVNDLRDGQVAILQNLRFHPGEKANDEAFARELHQHCDVYISDAFGVSHRAHASVNALPKLVPDRAAGLLLEREMRALSRLKGDRSDPLVAVLGGAKVDDKIGVVEALLHRLDALIIGGAMANTFLAAKGMNLGESRVEQDRLPLARTIIDKAAQHNVELLLPTDLLVAESLEASTGNVCGVDAVPAQSMALDIGPETIERFRDRLSTARLVFWNGPMGLFENRAFASGTQQIAEAIGASPGFTVVGGGDSVAAIQQAGLTDRFDHVSTGGGASLHYLEGQKMPGLEALRL